MAKSLIETLSSDFKPEQYVDNYQTALRELIERKIKHVPPSEKAAAPRAKGPVVDLLAVLQESIRASADKRKKPAGPRSRGTAALVKQKRRTGALN